MIKIERRHGLKIQVLDDELLLASFSDMEAAVEYAKATELKLRKSSPNEVSHHAGLSKQI